MNFEEYAVAARVTATYRGRGTELGLAYAVLGLAGEAGEVADEIKKAIGLGEYNDSGEATVVEAGRNAKIIKELGDVAWYFVAVCDELGIDPAEILAQNIAKIRARQAAGTLLGGDRATESIEKEKDL